jgi:membrane-bound ClpP family serine protease
MDWITITVLILAGLVLLAFEVYVPGFILGSIGVVLLAVAGYLCYRAYGASTAAVVGIIEVLLALGIVFASLKWFPETAAGRRMILAKTQTGVHSQTERPQELVGREGVAHTMLRPTGVAMVDGKRLDVVAESGMIERGSAIKIVAVQENRLLVRKL